MVSFSYCKIRNLLSGVIRQESACKMEGSHAFLIVIGKGISSRFCFICVCLCIYKYVYMYSCYMYVTYILNKGQLVEVSSRHYMGLGVLWLQETLCDKLSQPSIKILYIIPFHYSLNYTVITLGRMDMHSWVRESAFVFMDWTQYLINI